MKKLINWTLFLILVRITWWSFSNDPFKKTDHDCIKNSFTTWWACYKHIFASLYVVILIIVVLFFIGVVIYAYFNGDFDDDIERFEERLKNL